MSDMHITVTSSGPAGDGATVEHITSHWIAPPEQPWIFDLPREAWQIEDDEDD